MTRQRSSSAAVSAGGNAAQSKNVCRERDLPCGRHQPDGALCLEAPRWPPRARDPHAQGLGSLREALIATPKATFGSIR